MDSKIKCKFYPNCLNKDECFFVHDEESKQDEEEDKYCIEGDNCKNQSCEREHRSTNNILCRYQSKCSKSTCRFKHMAEKASFLGGCAQNLRKK